MVLLKSLKGNESLPLRLLSLKMKNSEKVLLEKLNKIIEGNFSNPDFSVDDICVDLGVSRSQLYRIIKQQTNLSTSLYVRQQKLIKAKKLLASSTMQIAEIAYFLGIDSPQNFSKYFTQEFGVSPTEYRKQQQIKGDEPIQIDTLESALEETQVITKKTEKYIYWVIALVVVILGFIAAFLWQRNSEAPTDIESDLSIPLEITENSIAILPFKNLGTPDNAMLTEGIMEQIHNSLAQINSLKVISTTSSNQYFNTKKKIQQIADELHVKYLMEGTVLQMNNQISINVQLINAKEDRVVWTRKFEGNNTNVFTYMNSVTKSVVDELNQKLSSGQMNKLNRIPTKSLEAYNEYLQGQQLLQTRTQEKMEASIIKTKNAIKLDSGFADAYTNIALAYFVLGEDQSMNEQEATRLAEKNALTAIRLDAENGRAYAILGNIYKAQNKWEQAITTFQIALKFSPNDAQINYWYSLTVRAIGLLEEAVKYSSKAVALDPLSSNIYGGHIIGCAYAGKFTLAENAIKEGEFLFNDSNLFHNAKGFYFITRQNYADALNEFKLCLRLYPKSIPFQTMISYNQAKLGQTALASLFLKALPEIPENYKNFGIIYAGLGNRELCLKYLEMAADANNTPNSLKVSPVFRFLHNDPRFNKILQKAGLLNVSLPLK